MEINKTAAQFRYRKTTSSDRFLGPYIYAPPQNTAATTASSEDETELNEDDIFSAGDFSESANNHHHRQTSNGSSTTASSNNSPPSSTSSTPRNHFHHHHHNTSNLSPNHKAFQPAEPSGILAALPENKSDSPHHVYQKTAVSSSSSASSASSASRLIPLIPKPPHERVPLSASVSRFHRHQSAPVNVPVLSMAMRRTREREFDEIDEDAEEAGGEMLPPHEIVARAQSPVVASSVLEGVGRTLKGRDLRQVKVFKCSYHSWELRVRWVKLKYS